jgi:NADH-quinone oxidoreductase subunit M
MVLLLTTVPTIMQASNHVYIEPHKWITNLGGNQGAGYPLGISFTLFVDGISLPIALVTLLLTAVIAIYSPRYFGEKHNHDAGYYPLLMGFVVGLVGVFISSNLLVFYFSWEGMLIPAYFLVGGWGYNRPARTAFKFFIFTHAGAVFVLLGIGAVYWFTLTPTNTHAFVIDILYIQQNNSLSGVPLDAMRWILIAFTIGFAIKMGVFPVHQWLPSTYTDSPSPISSLLGGVVTSAGAYAILRICLLTILPPINSTPLASNYLHALSIVGVVSAFYGGFIALVRTDIKHILSYSSISQMGYLMFGLSLFPIQAALTGVVMQIVNNAATKGMLFLGAGADINQVKSKDVREMGGLAGQMPWTSTTTVTAALCLGGIPPLACFYSELLIFLGAFQKIATDAFYIWTTVFMLVTLMVSLAYVLRFIARVHFGTPNHAVVKEVPASMIFAMVVLVLVIIIIGVWPAILTEIIGPTVNAVLPV